jgi:hypothetical protein
MRLTLIQLTTFATKWSKLGLSDSDLEALESVLVAKPDAGSVIPGTGGLRKLRFAPPSWHTGKRGAARVIYAFIAAGSAVYLFILYGKNQQSDLTAEEKKVFHLVLKRLQDRHRQ